MASDTCTTCCAPKYVSPSGQRYSQCRSCRVATETERLNRLRGALLDDACVRCGFTDVRALQLDHIHDDGHLDRKGKKHSSRVYREERDRRAAGKAPRLQTLCANCNWIKRYE